ncbi:dolichyl-phosphate-mannose--protein O-mannosyl transferase [Actinoplanes lutulentus]|uniref:Polyprenol-phosphate-mannose--protein mannosyltransferase n=1 Tax=Actinoplanes lutulentus TaxID=1287878 RepID=A0A327ZKW4_9ACTN|nr:phospholipid carrier-dependent glycosyltransferase [Actinoplanes lutulentus]MBB2945969.1 dolichyl-phosphate-mannose--protein O-mannosyl transferase [Actinoplanes lutulentus]RAK38017.1 dolichyl-phosphate-mannose-protein mannosyltransferase [Actinoplanes lutulentus]
MTTAATAENDLTTPDSPTGAEQPTGVRAVPEIVRRRLSTLDQRFNPYSWIVTAIIVVIAAILRFSGLSRPKGYIFDEVYYPTDAWDMLQHGVEWDEKTNGPAYVVHPPLGKWLIAFGEHFFGNTELGWRFSTAVAGTLMILVLIRVAYRLFHSIVLAGTAGLLMTLDGFQLVLSRTSLLDIFLGLFILLTFAAMVLDRDHYRRSWQRHLDSGYDPATTARLPLIVPWWLLVAGITFGMACGVKWSALFFAPFFAALVIVWRVQARRSAGIRGPIIAGILGDLGWLVLAFVLTFLVYLASWTGWFVTDTGYFRHYREANGMSEPPIIGALLNLAHYHSEAYNFHSGLTEKHTYQSWPWQWLLLGRPVAFYWNGNGDCGASNCAAEILLLGTPILWWSFLPALGALVWFGIARRDWRAYAIFTGAVAGLLPWFYFAVADGRTMFSFYVLPALPFLILAVVYVLGAIMTPPTGLVAGPSRSDRQLVGTVVLTTFVVLVALCFAYFYPVFVGTLMPYDDWSVRMWLGSRWI